MSPYAPSRLRVAVAIFLTGLTCLVWRAWALASRRVPGLVLLLALLAPQAALGQPWGPDRALSPFPTAGERLAADWASWGTALAAAGLDAKASWDCPDRRRCFALQGVRLGVTYGAALLVKRLVGRSRPCSPACGIDSPDSSFYSAHTALAFSAVGGPRLAVSLPLAVGTAGLRIGAGKHWLTDTLVGAGAGLLASRIR